MNTKSHVGMLHHICPVCDNKANTDILLDKRLKDSLEKDNYILSDSPCDNCQSQIDDGFIAMVAINNANKGQTNIKQEDAERTGEIAWLKRHAFEQIFNLPEPYTGNMVFIDPDVITRLKEKMNA